jgi:hypothetical protein
VRATLLAIVLAAGCTSASDFGAFHAGPDDVPDLSMENLDDLGIEDLRRSFDGRLPDFARNTDLTCGFPGASCCMGTTCVTGCCSNGMCVAIGSSCAGQQSICVTGQPPLCADCGHPNQICCAMNSCSMGGCCNMGVCIGSGEPATADSVCENNSIVACGGDGQPCCAYNYCPNGGCCFGESCVGAGKDCVSNVSTCNMANGGCGSCGALGFACCQGSPNGGGAADFCTGPGSKVPEIGCNPIDGQCEACGGLGQPCCDGNRCDNGGCCDHGLQNNVQTLGSCVSVGNSCSANNGALCTPGGDCSGCGGINQPPCGGMTGCTAAFSLNQNNTCVRCGGLGEPCCAGHNGGYCAEPFACDGKSCHPCGAQGQICCPGGVCKNGKGCQMGMCN